VPEVNLLAANATAPLSDRPDAPLRKDVVTDPHDQQIAELTAGNIVLGRGWIAPPARQPPAALHTAFAKTFADPAAIEGAKKRKMTQDSVSWQELQAVLGFKK